MIEASTIRVPFDLKQIDKTGWQMYQFDQIALNISERVEPQETDLEIYVGLEHLDPESVHIKRWGKPGDVDGTKLKVYPGDVIFGKRRAYQRKAALATFEGICSAHAMVLRPKPEVIEPELFAFFLHSDAFMHRAIDVSVGSLSPTINWKTLAAQQFLLPPIEQQTKLAQLICAADDTIEAYNKLDDQLLATLNSSYNEYFNQSGAKPTELGIIAEIVMGQSPDGSTYNQERVGLPLINGPTEFTDRYPIKVQWTSKPTKQCKEGDILLCVRGSTTGRINISNDVYCIGRGIAAIRGKSGFLTDYLEHLLRHFVGEILRLSSGSTFPNIDSKSLKSIKVPCYPQKEQEIIVKKLNDTSEASRALKVRISETRTILREIINLVFD